MRRSTARIAGAVISPTGRAPSQGNTSRSNRPINVVAWRTVQDGAMLRVPLARDVFQGVGATARCLRGLPSRARIDAGGQELAGLIAFGSGLLQPYVGVDAKG